MGVSVSEIKADVKEIKEKIHSIDITMAKNTQSLEDHMAQTNLLKEMVLPLHTERIERQAIKEYKLNQRAALYDKLKIPTFIVSAIAAIATVLKMLGKL